MNKFWEKYKEFIAIIIYVVFIACLFRFAVMPLNSSMITKKKQAEEKTIDYEISEKKMNEIPLLLEKMKDVKKNESKLNVFIEEENALPLIESIEKLAQETGNEIMIEIAEGKSTKDPKSSKDKESIKAGIPGDNFIIMTLNISGDFNSVYKFIYKMENFKYFSDIISIKISKRIKEEQKSTPVMQKSANFMQTGIINQETIKKDLVNEPIKNIEVPVAGTLEAVFYTEK